MGMGKNMSIKPTFGKDSPKATSKPINAPEAPKLLVLNAVRKDFNFESPNTSAHCGLYFSSFRILKTSL